MSDRLTIPRPDGFVLNIKLVDGHWSITTSGGPNITEDELQKIHTFTEGRDGAEDFMAKLRARAAR